MAPANGQAVGAEEQNCITKITKDAKDAKD